MTRLDERFASHWSPYQLNVGALALFGLLTGTGLAGLGFLPTLALGLVAIPLFVAIAAANWLFLIGLCPTCDKSPMLRQYGSGKWAEWLRRRLVWPERRCSECGHDLRLVPDDRP